MKHSILKTFAALMLTASFINYGALLEVPNFDIAKPITTTQTTATQNPVSIEPIYPLINWGCIKTQQVPPTDPKTEAVIAIPNTRVVPMSITCDDAAELLNRLRVQKPRTLRTLEPDPGYIKLFVGQISSHPLEEKKLRVFT